MKCLTTIVDHYNDFTDSTQALLSNTKLKIYRECLINQKLKISHFSEATKPRTADSIIIKKIVCQKYFSFLPNY